MVERDVLMDEKVQNYLDGRLNERDRAAVAACLLAHPDMASEVEMLRRQSEALRSVGQEILDEPIPARLREVLHGPEVAGPEVVNRDARSKPRAAAFLEVAAAILLFCAGGAVGWFLNQSLVPRLDLGDLIASNAAQAYVFYGSEPGYPLDFPPDQSAELAAWISRSFERDIPPPDLATLSYQYRGGQVLPTAGAVTGFYQFEGPDESRLAVLFWPAERVPSSVANIGRQANVSARYWLDDGLSFAVMSNETNPDLEVLADAVFAFYEQALGP